jgi:hypothetical protein
MWKISGAAMKPIAVIATMTETATVTTADVPSSSSVWNRSTKTGTSVAERMPPSSSS